jgi:2-polyprenyl-3-methyl-5-hydroxy-6-metoxy-1,4-benzoquinol methylase
LLDFTTTSLYEIVEILQSHKNNTTKNITFQVLNPDVASSTYNGTKISFENKEFIYRGYKTWIDLAQYFHYKMLTPKQLTKYTISITFEALNLQESFHNEEIIKEEKYGINSIFSQIDKNEESAFLLHYKKALHNVNINKRLRILNLGINSGDEFEIIQKYATNFQNLELIGIDYSPSAIQSAKEKFHTFKNITFHTHDINHLETLNLGKFDLIISIGTLQSSSLNFNKLFMSIVQNQLKKDGAMILGFPNCRWIDGEMVYGAKVKNYPFSEMSLLYKDAVFCKKYLQQKKIPCYTYRKRLYFFVSTK